MEQMNKLGYFVKPLDNLDEAELKTFLDNLDRGACEWFQGHLDKYQASDAMSCNYRIVRRLLDYELNPDTWLRNLFSSPKEMKQLFEKQAGWMADGDLLTSEAACKIVQKARAGNGNAQFQCWAAWTKTGFGIWAHVFPGYSAQVGKAVQTAASEVFGKDCSVVPGHVINAPPGGEVLMAHIDGFAPRRLMDLLKFGLSECDKLGYGGDWGLFEKTLGYQSLTHLDGARSAGDGTTWTLAPMTPRRLLLMLCVMHDHEVVLGGKFTQFWKKEHGPYFFDVNFALECLNHAIKCCRNGTFQDPVGYKFKDFIANDGLDAIVKKVPMSHADGPYTIAWIRGMPHGKDSNKTRRLSITTAINVTKPVGENVSRRSKRAWDFAELDSDCNLTSKVAKQRILEDKTPLASGVTHKCPQTAHDLMTGPFHSLNFTPEQAALYQTLS